MLLFFGLTSTSNQLITADTPGAASLVADSPGSLLLTPDSPGSVTITPN